MIVQEERYRCCSCEKEEGRCRGFGTEGLPRWKVKWVRWPYDNFQRRLRREDIAFLEIPPLYHLNCVFIKCQLLSQCIFSELFRKTALMK